MKSERWTGIMVLGLVTLGWAGLLRASEDPAWIAFDKAEGELRGLQSALRINQDALDACREGIAVKRGSELAGLRQALAEAEKGVAAAHTQAGLDEARTKLQAAQAARDAKVESLVAAAPTFQAAKRKQAEWKKSIDEKVARIDKLTADELRELARQRAEERALDKHLYGSRRAWWRRGEVAAEYQTTDQAYQAYSALSGKSEALKQANASVKAARQALNGAMAALPLEGAASQEIQARCTELEAQIAALKEKIAGMEKNLADGKTIRVAVREPDQKTKKDADKNVLLWLPLKHDYIRGIIVAHLMIDGLATSRPMRLAAAREGLGTMVADNFLIGGGGSLATLDALFEKFATASGHPELRGAPVLVGGLSASVLGTRNIACVTPSRVFGVVQVAGGNLHQMPDGGRGMVGVPFLAQNGEFEWCGPEGGGHASGKAGIRLEYGNQTQWLMVREQMLRLWRNKYEHRMSLVVVPNADHGAWDVGLTALFVRKAAKYRLPKEKRDGSTPAVCTPLPVNQGWLTDADLDHPKHPPAPYDSYTGDKNNAFWHLDEEMAQAVYQYEQNRFILPDPTKDSPVPADWPPVRK